MPKLRSNTHKIPTFAADGRKLRAYSLEAIEHLESLSLVVAKRNRRGLIVAAHFRPQDGANPLRASCNMGQRYSFLSRVGNERCWALKTLIPRQDIEALTGQELESPEDVDLYLRGVFRAVVLDRLKENTTCTKTN